jgi:hypothetical protein
MKQILKSCPSVKDTKNLMLHIASIKRINEGITLPAEDIRSS